MRACRGASGTIRCLRAGALSAAAGGARLRHLVKVESSGFLCCKIIVFPFSILCSSEMSNFDPHARCGGQ